MQDLTITTIQSDLEWENPEQNKACFSDKIDAVEQTDLIILPEMFTTAFTMEAAKWAETEKGPTLQWMINKAQQKNADLIGSVIVEENGAYYNRLYWVHSDGTYHKYDKRHLFRMAGEHKIYNPGKRRLIQQLKKWRIMPLICYDLRFPVWSRTDENCDLMIFIANWPERRSAHWRLLLQARAIENQLYVAGVNRVGKDGKNIEYRGDTSIIDPLGQIIKQDAFNESVQTVTLSWEKLQAYREKFPVWKDADTFKIE